MEKFHTKRAHHDVSDATSWCEWRGKRRESVCTYPIFKGEQLPWNPGPVWVSMDTHSKGHSYPYGCPLKEFHFERDQFWKLSNLVQCEETATKECAIQGVMFEEVASGQGTGFKSVFVWQSICWFVPWEWYNCSCVLSLAWDFKGWRFQIFLVQKHSFPTCNIFHT